MFRPRVIPVLLLQGEGLVKTVMFAKPTYVGDPINAVHLFNDMRADELVFLDISATRERRCAPIPVVERIGDEAYMPFAVGGGVRTLADMKALFGAGAEKVVVNTAATENPDLIAAAADTFGSQSIIVSIDAKRDRFGAYRVRTVNGSRDTGKDPVAHAVAMQSCGAGEIMINSIERDGTMQGYDLELVKRVASAVDVPVIACGGAGATAHFAAAVTEGGASAVAAGSLFVFQGPRRGVLISYPEKNELFRLFNA